MMATDQTGKKKTGKKKTSNSYADQIIMFADSAIRRSLDQYIQRRIREIPTDKTDVSMGQEDLEVQ